MSEYLASWTKEQGVPNFEQFRIVAEEGDSRVLQLRDVMTRFSMPFGFYPVDSEAGRRLLDEAGLDSSRLPVVIRYDGQVMVDPSLPDLAGAVGVSVKNDVDTCDVAIVGSRRLTAAHAVEGLRPWSRRCSRGQAGASPLIRNYPGFPHGINGGVLMGRTCEQAWLMGAHIVFAQQAVALEPRGDYRVVRLLDGSEVCARTVVIATGMEWRRLGVPRLEALVGSGVYYGAAVSESRAMQGQDVFIVAPTQPVKRPCTLQSTLARSHCSPGPTASPSRCRVTSFAPSSRLPTSSFASAQRWSTAEATAVSNISRLPTAAEVLSKRFPRPRCSS
jgi:thioredoxin reductase (NADPH)